MAAQNDAVRTNYIKANIDKALEDGKWRLYDYRDELLICQ